MGAVTNDSTPPISVPTSASDTGNNVNSVDNANNTKDQSESTSMRALTGEEQALYDRQIRLWGVEAQRKLASSHVLLVCDMTCVLAQEIAKNIVLAGIARLVVQKPVDDSAENTTGEATKPQAQVDNVEDHNDVQPGFLGGDEETAIQSLREMNPLVDISVSSDSSTTNTLNAFRVVCAVSLTREQECALGDRTRAAKVPLLCGRVAGEVGWVFIDDCSKNCVPVRDAVSAKWGGEVRRGEFGWHVTQTLQEFQTTHNGRMPGAKETDDVEIEKMYKSLCEKHEGAHLKSDVVRRAAKAACYTMPPIASVVGGLWGREIIKVIAGRETPLGGYNFFFFNAASSKGSVEKVGMR